MLGRALPAGQRKKCSKLPTLDSELWRAVSQRRGDCYRVRGVHGEQAMSKRLCKQQQMQWSKQGVHLLLQTRVKTLNRDLGSLFKRWYPDMHVEELPDAASSQHLHALDGKHRAGI
jgi:hypothetical protein